MPEAGGVVGGGGNGATKEVFYIPNHGTESSARQSYPGYLINAVGETAFIIGRFPHDFVAISEMTVLIIPNSTANHRFNIESRMAGVGEATGTHLSVLANQDIPLVLDILYEFNIASQFVLALADDYFGILFTGQATNEPNCLICGVRLKYT